MATPIYGIMSDQPRDVFGYLAEQYQLKLLLGTITRSSDGRAFESLGYGPTRANLTFSAISGLDVVVSDSLEYETVDFEDGTQVRYNVLTIYSAHYGTVTFSQLLKELKRSGYSHQETRALQEADYASAVGGTGDYSGASDYYRIKVRAGAGRRVPGKGVNYASPIEVGQGGTGGEGGYEFTGGFSDRLSGQSGANDFGTLVSYTQEMADNNRWLRFGFSEAARDANDAPYFPVGSDYDGTQGLFGGEHLPRNCTRLIDYADSTAYNNAVTTGDLQYNAAGGSLDFTTCRVGDLALVRFDFNVVPQIANTTIEIAMIWQTRGEADNPTFTFALTGTPVFYGTGSVGKTFLSRPLISAYFASEEDVNARALLAVRADNPIQVAPLTTLVTIQR
ncbi:hypothetical protein SCRES1_gp91 [Synechococcus phage S-CRES1]|nr:hypothetical protein SCRES1_gp91 [Synechococcus phage S-CRES1]